ncbi:hypothetical protein [Alteromonas sp. CYL-A6]|uniref:hypothetical protein n=1 Tax=Alteromonas nitratireducens TaxID=3390813 RepID=UPI0034B63F9D
MKTIKGMDTVVIIRSTLFYLSLCGALMTLDYWYATSQSPLASRNITQQTSNAYRIPLADKTFDLAMFDIGETLTPMQFREAVTTVLNRVDMQDISYSMFCKTAHCEIRIASDDAAKRAELIHLVAARVKQVERVNQ